MARAELSRPEPVQVGGYAGQPQSLPRNSHCPTSGVPLTPAASVLILGVAFTSDLSSAVRTANAVAKARRLLGFVAPVSRMCGPATFRVLYTALVLPHLEFCCAVWCSCQAHIVDSLESVQRRANRTFFTRQNEHSPPFECRLKRLRWEPLPHWRRMASLNLTCCLFDGCLRGGIHCVTPKTKRKIRAASAHPRSDPSPELLADLGRDRRLSYGPTYTTHLPLPHDRTESTRFCCAFARGLRLQQP